MALEVTVPRTSPQRLITLSQALDKDLRDILGDTKKKLPDLQLATDRASQRLKTVIVTGGVSDSEDYTEALQSDTVIRPLLLTLSQLKSNTKVTLLALSSLQRLLSLHPLTNKFLSTLIGILRILSELDEPSVQLKILQSLLLCINESSLQCGEILTTSFLQSLGICFKLYSSGNGSKNPMIANTALGALKQIVGLLYERIAADSVRSNDKAAVIESESVKFNDEIKSNYNGVVVTNDDGIYDSISVDNLSVVMANGFLLFRDLVILSNVSEHGKTSPHWLTLSLPSSATPTLCLDLLLTILCSQSQLFVVEPAFYVLLKRDLCVMLARMLRSNFDYAIVVRIQRIIQFLLKSHSLLLKYENEIFMTVLIKMLGSEFSVWQHCLVLDTLLSSVTIKPSIIYYHYTQYDDKNQNKIVSSICHCLGQFVSNASVSEASQWGRMLVSVKQQSARNKLFDSDSDSQLALIDETLRLTLAIENTIQIVNNLAQLTSLTDNNTDAVIDGVPVDRAVLKRLVLACWTPMLASLSNLLAKTNDEAQVQYLLLAYQSFTNTCGSLALIKPRDSLLTSLCSFAIKKQFPRDENIQDLLRDVLSSSTSADTQPLLTAKNIQSLKALFNIAHCLGSLLTSAWTIVLDTFHSLDTIIQLTKEIQSRSLRESNPSIQDQYQRLLPPNNEVMLLTSALERFFESTKYLDDAAVSQVVSTLGALALTALAATQDSINQSSSRTNTISVSASDSPVRLFSLANLIATIEHNMFRISSAKLWELGINHLTCVITHRDTRMRAYGVEALKKLTTLALTKRPTAGTNTGTLQSDTLSPMMELYIKSKYDDTRAQLLQSLHSILQLCGPSMLGGWTVILDWLSAVCEIGGTPGSPRQSATDTDAKVSVNVSQSQTLISFGFNSLQLIVNDFIDSIPFPTLNSLIKCIGCYCVQRYDTNISFTSIGLLWRVSDYIARIVGIPIMRKKDLAVNGTSTETYIDSVSNGNGSVSEEVEVLSEPAADALMLALFTQLHALSLDLRSEVRNSAVKTFSSTLAAHGSRMRANSCIACLTEFELPLLTELMRNDNDREKHSAGIHTRELGRDKESGRSVMMMVHHSRDTAEKQWDETRVYALQGSARVYKVFIENWAALPDFSDRLWPQYCQLLSDSVNHRSTEVSLAAINAMQELIVAPSSQATFSETLLLFQSVLDAYRTIHINALAQSDAIQLAANTGTTFVSLTDSSLVGMDAESAWKHWLKVYTQLVATFHHLFTNTNRQLFNNSILAIFVNIVTELSLVQVPSNIRRRGVIDSETSLQSAALKCLESLLPCQDREQFALLVTSVIRMTAPQPAITPFTRKSLKLLEVLFTSTSDNSFLATHFAAIMLSLQSLMMATNDSVVNGSQEECEELIQSFIRIVQHGLVTAESGSDRGGMWQSLLAVLDHYLDPSHTIAAATAPTLSLSAVPRILTPRTSPSEQQLWEHFQIAMIGMLVNQILPTACRELTLEQQWRLMTLLDCGWTDTSPSVSGQPQANELLSHACLMGLLALVNLTNDNSTGTNEYCGLLALPLLVHRCQHILSQFASDHRQHAHSLSQARVEEVAFILRELNALTVPSSMEAILLLHSDKERVGFVKGFVEQSRSGGGSDSSGSNGHLVALRYALCECVSIHESELREIVRALLIKAFQHLDVITTPTSIGNSSNHR